MQVVIDITELSWNELQAIKKNNSDSLKFWQKMIAEGIPLPKNHGDLKDINDLIPSCKLRGGCPYEQCDRCSDNAVSYIDILEANTIIKAENIVEAND